MALDGIYDLAAKKALEISMQFHKKDKVKNIGLFTDSILRDAYLIQPRLLNYLKSESHNHVAYNGPKLEDLD